MVPSSCCSSVQQREVTILCHAFTSVVSWLFKGENQRGRVRHYIARRSLRITPWNLLWKRNMQILYIIPAEQRRSWLSSEAYVNDDSPVCLWCDCDRAPCVVSPPLLRSDWVTRHGRAVVHHHYHHHQTGSNDKIIIPAQTGQRSAHLDTAVRSYRWTLNLGQRSGPPCQFYCQQ